MKPAPRNALLCVLLLLAPPALALDGFGVLTGTVLNGDTRELLSGVVVTATSPDLMGEQVVVTDENGFYRIPQLPPGIYWLRFDYEGLDPHTVPTIVVRLNRTYRLNVHLTKWGIENPSPRYLSAPWPNWCLAKP